MNPGPEAPERASSPHDLERASSPTRERERDPNSLLSTADGSLADGADQTERHGFESLRRKDMVAAALFDEPLTPLDIGRYTIVRELGAGGMGIVYLAYDEQLDRRVAIKLLRSGTDDRASHRLQREAQAMARLSHPNVVTVHEVSTHRGQVFVAMEYVQGQDLRRWLGAQPRSRAAILAAFVQAGEGLVAAHEVGIVHRDFKPDNVLVGDDGRLRVADFGLAHALGSEAPTEPRSPAPPSRLDATLTQTGALIGTPAYMAPEQFLGRETDARSDQFSFCVALWEALEGRRPFAGKSVAELSYAVTSGVFVERERSEVPTWLRTILLRGLARDPSERWPTMRSLLDALQRDPTRRRRAAWIGASLLGLGLALVVGASLVRASIQRSTIAACEREGAAIRDDWNAALAAGLDQRFAATGSPLAASAWLHTRATMAAYAEAWSSLRTQSCIEAQVDHSRPPLAHERIAECLDERRATFDGLLEAWAEPDPEIVARAIKAAAGLPPASACTQAPLLAERARPPQPLVDQVAAARAQLEGARAFELAGRYPQALARAQQVFDAARELDWLPLEAEAELMVGKLEARLGHYDAAVEAYRGAFQSAAGGGDDLVMLFAATNLGADLAYYLAQPREARYWGELGQLLVARLDLAGTIHEASLLNSLGVASFVEGDLVHALEFYTRSLAIKQAVLGPEHLDVAASLNNIGVVEIDMGDDAAALAHFRRALAIQIAVLGPDHLDVAASQINIGIVLERQAALDEALEVLHEALAIQTAALGPDHPDLATTLTNLGNVQADRGELDDALVSQRRALALERASLGPDHPDLAITLNNLADVLVEQGHEVEALEPYRRALAIQEAALGSDHPALGYSLTGLGRVELSLGELDSARSHLERALVLREGGDPDDLASTRALLDQVDSAGR